MSNQNLSIKSLKVIPGVWTDALMLLRSRFHPRILAEISGVDQPILVLYTIYELKIDSKSKSTEKKFKSYTRGLNRCSDALKIKRQKCWPLYHGYQHSELHVSSPSWRKCFHNQLLKSKNCLPHFWPFKDFKTGILCVAVSSSMLSCHLQP